MSRRLIITLLIGLACAAAAGGALAAALHSQTATARGVTATFSYRGAIPAVTGAHLTIVDAGRTLYDQPVTSRACADQCGPGEISGRHSSLAIVPLITPGSSQVVLELYSGGANCCFVDQVFSLDPGTMTYVKTEHNFFSAGATLKKVHGRYRFLSADDAFKYAFTDGASSGEPIQIWAFRPHGFADVTRSYPGMIRSDAAYYLRAFHHNLANGVGLIAAWAGDEELLGHDALVQSTLKSELAKGELRAGPGNFFPGGARFIHDLNRVLRRLGYKH